MALVALIIKEKLGITDRETVEQIKENPYLQYFLGMSTYSSSEPFESSRLARSLARSAPGRGEYFVQIYRLNSHN